MMARWMGVGTLALGVAIGIAWPHEVCAQEESAAAESSEAPAEEPAGEPAESDEELGEEAGSDAGSEPAAEDPANVDGDSASDSQGRPPASAAEAPEMPSNDEASFNLQLRGLQERVDELKQKVYKSKARLTQLKEVVMHGAISGAKARLVHKNEMGSSFRLIRVQYSLDGAPILNRADTGDGSLDDLEELEVFNGSIAPGEHQISVYLEYAGDGYGIFNYLKNYTFKIKSSFNFTAEEGKLTKVDIVGYEKGNFTTELQDRVAVRYDQSVERATRTAEERGQSESEPE